jgi:antitoxin (DNA-binding transcriptional repressor) of toxin-antitoxin stability system
MIGQLSGSRLPISRSAAGRICSMAPQARSFKAGPGVVRLSNSSVVRSLPPARVDVDGATVYALGMPEVASRVLKQNPQAAIRRVLDGGEPLEITVRGRPTGVQLALAPPPGLGTAAAQAELAEHDIAAMSRAAGAWGERSETGVEYVERLRSGSRLRRLS